MRIRQTSQTPRRSPSARAHFVFGLAAGSLLGLALLLVYRLSGSPQFIPQVRTLWTRAAAALATPRPTGELPRVYLDIGFAEYQTLAQQRDEAVAAGILTAKGDNWQNATIRYGDASVKVRLRLKGDWVDHLRDDKWSFRVETRQDDTFMGMRSFSLQSPETRAYLNEWLFLEDLRATGVLAPRYSFATLIVNGESWGLYAIEESFSKELLESQQRREGPIVRFDETALWAHRAALGPANWQFRVDAISSPLESYSFAPLDLFNANKTASDPALSQQAEAALGLLRGYQSGALGPSQVFDVPLLARFLAHANVWDAAHGLGWHNQRYYYNPLTTRLEPIAYDAMPQLGSAAFVNVEAYGDLEVYAAYLREAQRLADPAYWSAREQTFGAEQARLAEILATEFDPAYLRAPWDQLAARRQLLAGTLHPPISVLAYDSEGPEGTLRLQVANVLRTPVVLSALRVGEQTIPLLPEWVTTSDATLSYAEALPQIVLRPVRYALPLYLVIDVPRALVEEALPEGSTLASSALQIVTNLYGLEDEIAVAVTRNYPPELAGSDLPARPSVAQALAQHPFLRLSERAGLLSVQPGEWLVQGDLILPEGYGLLATEALALKFAPGAVLLTDGPLLLSAPEGSWIELGPQERSWAGLVVLSAGEARESHLEHVEIWGADRIARGGWNTTGGITFYESPVALAHCWLHDSRGEDLINVLRTQFTFVDTRLERTASDALDVDFGSGTLERCIFADTLGDGIDVSGTDLLVKDCVAAHIRDKALSAGEGSAVRVLGLRAFDVAFGIASKDASSVAADHVTVERAIEAAFAAYTKKPEYGPASVVATRVTIADCSAPALVQTNSSATLNGQLQASSDIDIPALYARLEQYGKLQRVDYRLGEHIRLLGYLLTTPVGTPNGYADLLLYWQTDAPLQVDYNVFVHVRDAQGAMGSVRNIMPRADAFPTTQWPVGELLDDWHQIHLPGTMAPGAYSITVGLFDAATGERLPIVGSDGQRIPDDALRLDLELWMSE